MARLRLEPWSRSGPPGSGPRCCGLPHLLVSPRWDPHSKGTPAGREASAVPETARELAGRTLDDTTLAEYLAGRFDAGRSPAVAGSRGGSVRGLRDAGLLAVMSDGLLRVSEGAALEVNDLEAEGAVQYIGGPTVDRVRAWLEAAGLTTGPMFQRLDRAGRPRGRLSTVPDHSYGA